jgi:hypothetical protein
MTFAVICLVMGTVAAVTVPSRMRASEPGEGLIARLLATLIVISFVIFLWSLGGAGIALAERWSGPAYAMEGAAVISGFALLLFPLIATVYWVVRLLLRRRAGA